jgi:hypothetical protein
MAATLQLPTRDQIAALSSRERMQLAHELHRAECELLAAQVDLVGRDGS